jgi:hypothetical protein
VVNDPDCDGTTEDAGSAPAVTSAPATAAATEPATTAAAGGAPATTAAAPPATNQVLPVVENFALGDSVMLGAAGALGEVGFQVVDARESRQFSDGLETVRTLRAQDRLGERVVIHLGTNGYIDAGDMTAMMEELAEVPQVLVLTVDVDREWTGPNNTLVYDAANTYANVELLDWQGLASSCPGNCFYDDVIHLRPDGQAYYSALIAQSLGMI